MFIEKNIERRTESFREGHSISIVRIHNWDVFFWQYCKIILPNYSFSGVYLIGDFYVGSSSSIRGRLKNHIHSSINNHHHNKDVGEAIKKGIKSGFLQIKMLSNNKSDEYYFIHKLIHDGFPLLNKDLTPPNYSRKFSEDSDN